MCWTTHWSVAVLVIVSVKHGGSHLVAGKPTKCPPNVQSAIMQCLDGLGGIMGPGGGHHLFSDLNETKNLCQSGKLQAAVSCLEMVYNDCASMSHEGNMNVMLDEGTWRSIIEKLCNNIDYLRSNKQCSDKIATSSRHCIQDRSRKLQQQLLQATGQKELMDLNCEFAVDVILCFKTPLDHEDNDCPCRYRHLIVNLITQSMPPACKIDDEYYYYYYAYQICLGDSDENVVPDPDDFELPLQGPGYSHVSDDSSVNENNGSDHKQGLMVLKSRDEEERQQQNQQSETQGHKGNGARAVRRAAWSLVLGSLVAVVVAVAATGFGV